MSDINAERFPGPPGRLLYQKVFPDTWSIET
jgi:hypothetical protein